ncbi:unnamed protein product [Pleuronectes platessa]|uniref:Calcium-independent phospholipase A2-gamma n=1 Tax=Pleuronectes platessa TaxID=8262 RepID=A0A9N7UWX7_PLEPL|nr:unnamed protein product [Pleuronectes platessa]
MSRIRTTLDSVTKAVGSTDLISKFSRFKPGGAAVGSTHAEKPEPVMKEQDGGEKNTAEEELDKQSHQVIETPLVATNKSTSGLASAAKVSAPGSSTTVAKQSTQLFHPTALSTNMDETYNTLAQHINSYFGTNTQGEDVEHRPVQPDRGGDVPVSEPVPHPVPRRTGEHTLILSPVAEAKNIEPLSTSPSEKHSPPVGVHSSDTPATENIAQPIPVPTTSAKKGFTRYLSYPRPSVQAFVGSYIAPLVPKFRSESKSAAAEKEKAAAVAVGEPAGEKREEKTDVEEKTEERKQELLTQRQKIIARVSVDNRTRALVKGLLRVTDVKLLTSRVEELSHHLREFPETRGVAIKASALPCLLRLRQARDLPLQSAVREALALVGYTEPVKGRGIRVLAIDGGGTGKASETFPV